MRAVSFKRLLGGCASNSDASSHDVIRMLSAMGTALQCAVLAVAPEAACSGILPSRTSQIVDLCIPYERMIPRTISWRLDSEAIRTPISSFKPPSLATVAAYHVSDPTAGLFTNWLKTQLKSGTRNLAIESDCGFELTAWWQHCKRGL